jgi:LPXTG-site transpeptidase (sortase) family protein
MIKALRSKRTLLLAALLLVAVCAGAYFLLAPGAESGKAQARQDELLTSITEGDGVITVPAAELVAAVDYYDPPPDGAAHEPDFIAADVLPLAAAPADPETPAEETAGVSTDTGTITGLGVLTIEKIDLTLPISEGVSETQLNISPGHVPQTAAIGGTGNAVIAGHRSYEDGKHFNRLGELEAGDLIQYQSRDGEIMTFAVFEILEVEPGDQTAFAQPDDAQLLTLYTCTPIRTATHRLLVRAERVI